MVLSLAVSSAFEIIKEYTLNAPDSHSIGLTLFDDTIRGFVAPERLEKQHIVNLHQALADAPQAIRPTSNLAVGIERSIDRLKPKDGANLVVFSRGVIDTKSDDPRARYIEWLDDVLLPQAAMSDIAISLVVQQNQSNSNPISAVFAKTDVHRIIVSTAGSQLAPELASLLNITERPYGQAQSSVELAAESMAVKQEVASSQENQVVTQNPSSRGVLPMARIGLLTLCIATLFGLLLWRYYSRRATRNADETAHSSSTYLPLTQKPGESMEQYMDRETDLAVKPDSRNSK